MNSCKDSYHKFSTGEWPHGHQAHVFIPLQRIHTTLSVHNHTSNTQFEEQ